MGVSVLFPACSWRKEAKEETKMFFVTMTANFLCHLDWAEECPGVFNIMSVCFRSVEVFSLKLVDKV